MGEIFSKAKSVIAWLGESGPSIKIAVDAMNLTAPGCVPEVGWHAVVGGVKELMQKEYWTRMWIVQEFVLAGRKEFWCGELSLEEEAWEWLLWDIGDYKDFEYSEILREEILNPPMSGAAIIVGYKSLFRRRNRSLTALVRLFTRSMRCMDVRHRLYSLHGIADLSQEVELLAGLPDYSISAAELFDRIRRLTHQEPEDLDEIRRILGV